jgi:hypothetical protein
MAKKAIAVTHARRAREVMRQGYAFPLRDRLICVKRRRRRRT